MKPIMSSTDWSKERLIEIYNQLEILNTEKYKLDVYDSQIEIVPYSWMIENHASHGGLPILYKHWSFGKAYVNFSNAYRSGQAGLAYEMVLNTEPNIAYCMEENTEIMQALVMAHAGYGHNFVFKNNYLFKEWTDASEILDYLEFSRNYISRCEEKYGEEIVEKLLDIAHMLQWSSFTRFKRNRKFSIKEDEKRRLERIQDYEKDYREIWETIPKSKVAENSIKDSLKRKMNLPEENILYFLEKFSPNLAVWQREVLRIVRNIGQYFYPNIQTNIVHESAAVKMHWNMLYDMYDKNLIDNGAMLEWLKVHSAVIYQPTFNQKFSLDHFNPYALGFAIAQDIERICLSPTAEDKEWFPDFAGCKDPMGQLKYAWANHRNESFVRQYLSPKLMRDFKMFSIYDDSTENAYEISNIHNEEGYSNIRSILANSLLLDSFIPNVEVQDADILGNRLLTLEFNSTNGHGLYSRYTQKIVEGIASIWGYPVKLCAYYTPQHSEKLAMEKYEAEPTFTFY